MRVRSLSLSHPQATILIIKEKIKNSQCNNIISTRVSKDSKIAHKFQNQKST